MQQTVQVWLGEICHHVISRGNGLCRVLRKDKDRQLFLKVMGHASVERNLPVPFFMIVP